MNYQIQYDNQDENLITRLLKIRQIDDNIEKFLNPKLSDYWIDPFLLNDMDKAVHRIIQAMKKREKIMVFGDYDVDGVTSSWMLYEFFRKFLGYHTVSIMYPDRMKDGYGIKKNHIDEIKKKNVDLIITVDNGITSIQEADYCKELGIDLIITDHHHKLKQIPQALAVVNPQVSPHYPFKGIAGVGVASKLVMAILTKSKFDKEKKNQIFNYFLPIVAIGTVADVAPIIDENRAIVKKGLEIMNKTPDKLPRSLQGFLKFLNLKGNIDTFHIGFVIGPRINAGGRLESPYQSLYTLMYEGEKQLQYLQSIDTINTERKKLQDEMFKFAEKQIDHTHNILIVESEDFHEGVVGIVSGKITEKYCKPSVVFKIDMERQQVVGSLRGPEYFNVIEMISQFGDLLERFGGHKQAGGVTISLQNFEKFKKKIISYCKKNIKKSDMEKVVKIDTKLYHHERDNDLLSQIEKLAPFGEGNKEPVFMLEGLQVEKVEKVGKVGKVGKGSKTHLKIYGKLLQQNIVCMFRGKGDEVKNGKMENLKDGKCNVVGKIKKDNFNGGYFVDGIEITGVI